MKNNKLTEKEIVDKLQNLDLKLFNQKYTIIKNKYVLIDSNGYKFYKQLDNLLYRGNKPKIIAKDNPFCIENLQHFYDLNNSNTQVLSKFYNGSPIEIKCGKCGNVFQEKQIHRIIKNNKIYCQNCLKKLSKLGSLEYRKKIKYKDVESEFQNKGYQLVDRIYKNCDTKMICKDEENYLYVSSYRNIKSNLSLPKFSVSNPFTIKNIKNYITRNDLSCKILTKDYIDSEHKMSFKCNCGNDFQTSLIGFLAEKNTCDKCGKSISRNEEKIENLLNNKNIKYIKEYTFNDCLYKHKLRFDFALFKKDKLFLLVEVDGEQHFKPCTFGGISKEQANKNYEELIIRDTIKDEYAKNNNIKLLRLPYYSFKNGDYKEILEKELKLS